MFYIVYEKSTGKVVQVIRRNSITGDAEMRDALPEQQDFIIVDTIPQIQRYRQELAVKNNCLFTRTFELTEEQEARIVKWEATDEINKCKALLAQTDYQAIKYAEGELTEEEYATTKELRRSYRAKINELEQKLDK